MLCQEPALRSGRGTVKSTISINNIQQAEPKLGVNTTSGYWTFRENEAESEL